MIAECRVCGELIAPFMSFGRMPIANGFLLPEAFADEHFFDLAPAFCEHCKTFQIVEQPDPELMFHDNYAFFTRTSRRMMAHFAEYGDWVREHWLPAGDPFVVEIGSNDGALIEGFARRGIRHLGVEPSSNVAAEAERHGVTSRVDFFSRAVAGEIRERQGPADAVLAANVMCHIPDLHGVAAGVTELLTSLGVLVFEEPYLGAMIENTSYDQIYDEHVYIFSAGSVQNIFGRRGLELIDVLPQATHGGSMRYVLARRGARDVSPRVADLLAREQAKGLNDPATYDRFRANCEASRDALVALLRQKKAEGKRVVGYGATSKSTTVLNYCNIGPDLIEFINDTTRVKQGRYTPGMHIPVRPYEAFCKSYPDSAVLFAWNHRDEIMAKEDGFREAGGNWINYVPEVAESR